MVKDDVKNYESLGEKQFRGSISSMTEAKQQSNQKFNKENHGRDNQEEPFCDHSKHWGSEKLYTIVRLYPLRDNQSRM